MITAEQIRAARAILRMDQKELAAAAGVSLPTVHRMEAQQGVLSGSYQTIGRIREALEKRGIVFTEHGVEQRRPSGKEAPTREE